MSRTKLIVGDYVTVLADVYKYEQRALTNGRRYKINRVGVHVFSVTGELLGSNGKPKAVSIRHDSTNWKLAEKTANSGSVGNQKGQRNILNYLVGKEWVSAIELADHLGITKQGLSKAMKGTPTKNGLLSTGLVKSRSMTSGFRGFPPKEYALSNVPD